jgi:hypothetical protein
VVVAAVAAATAERASAPATGRHIKTQNGALFSSAPSLRGGADGSRHPYNQRVAGATPFEPSTMTD